MEVSVLVTRYACFKGGWIVSVSQCVYTVSTGRGLQVQAMSPTFPLKTATGPGQCSDVLFKSTGQI